jgi:sugar/nucleoside kinase (ribokinase family)
VSAPETVVIGSVAIDTIETPHGRRDEVLGGSAVHFAMSARHFGRVGVVGVVGEDFPPGHLELLTAHGIDTRGIHRAPGRTFRWHGRYAADMNSRATVSVELGVFAAFEPRVPPAFGSARCVLLGNAHPRSQRALLDRVDAFTMLDTMDLWIDRERAALLALLPRVQVLCVNAEEALMLTQEHNLARAVPALLRMGPRAAVVKKAEHGAILATPDRTLALPAFPTPTVVDPTGAGDAFAGGFLGAVAAADAAPAALRRALAYGTVMGSFAVEGFGVEGLTAATKDGIEQRVQALVEMTRLD